MDRISIKTARRVELLDITAKIQEAVAKSKVKSGVCFVFCPHTTAGLTINENADPSVKSDMISALNKLIPENAGYAHSEGNADSHIKSSLFGTSLSIFIEDNKLCLGTWQGIYFCESDGARSRQVWVKESWRANVPELPEVETIKRELEKAVLGKKITAVSVHNPKVIREPGVEKFKKALQGVSIKNILRRAKVLILELSNGKALVIHLKMTGQLVYPGNGEKSRVSFHLSDGKTLDFNDQRLFAELRILDDWRSLKFIQGLGPEPSDLSKEQFKQRIDKKKTKIKPLLLDQTFVSGIGNLYAAEALFRARINPFRSAASLTDKEKDTLLKEIKDTLREATKHKGSSVDQYVQLTGSPGGYVKYHKVYDRAGKPCLVCKTPIQRITQAGRGTYFCPKCQK